MVILLVEDEKKQAEFIQKALEQDYYKVDVAYDGEEALKKAEVRDYDTMIFDLNLPKLDGATLIQKVREMGLSTPILVLTANDELDTKVANLDTGADDYLTKPFAIDELLARVRALLRREKVALPQTLLQKPRHLRALL
jgi:DNA-binding response OmpR family regulator